MFFPAGIPTSAAPNNGSIFAQNGSAQFGAHRTHDAFLGPTHAAPSACFQGFPDCQAQWTAAPDTVPTDSSATVSMEETSTIPPTFGVGSPDSLHAARKRKDDLSKTELECTDPDVLPPKAKRRTPEDRMAAKLRNFHITSHLHSDKHRPDAFFMKRPAETLEEIDSRLTDEDDDEMGDDNSASSDDFEPSIQVNPEFRKYLKAQRSSFSPWLRTPDSSKAVVLWKPSQNFVNGILEQSRIQEISPELHNTENSHNGYCQATPIVTFPPSPSDDEDDLTDDTLHQNRFSNHQSGFPFPTHNSSSSHQIQIQEIPRPVGRFYSSSQSEDNDESMEEL